MFYCQCSKPVRTTYCPDDNVHYPEENCQDCHDEEQFNYHVQQAFILQQRREMKRQLQQIEQEELPF
jgi:hypothetical protein